MNARMASVLVLTLLTLLTGRAQAQLCQNDITADSGFEGTSPWPDPMCPDWESGGADCETGQVSLYGGTGTNIVAEIDGEPRALGQLVDLLPGHPYAIQLLASRRTNTCSSGIPNPAMADVTLSNTTLGTWTISRTNADPDEPFALTSSSTTFTAGASAGTELLLVTPSGFAPNQTCGLLLDDIRVLNVEEDGAVFDYTVNRDTIGETAQLTVEDLTYGSDQYRIDYEIIRATGSPTFPCSTTPTTPTGGDGGSITFDTCLQMVAGDTVRIVDVVNVSANNCTTSDASFTHVILFPSSTAISAFEAFDEGARTVLRWRTGLEADNLGFHLYREDAAGQRTRLNPGLIAGSALQLRGGTSAQGRTYHWVDPRPAQSRASLGPAASHEYVLQSVAADGSRREYRATPRLGSLSWSGRAPSLLAARRDPIAAARRVDLSGRLPASRLVELHQQKAALSLPRRGAGAPLSLSAASSSGLVEPDRRWIARERPRAPHPDLCLLAGEASYARQWQLAGAEGVVKLSVDRTGLQRVSRAELLAAGLPASARSEDLAIFRLGRPVPLRVVGGGAGAPFEAVEFFGVRLDTVGAGAATYWLSVDPAAARPIAVVAPSSSATGRAEAFVETVELRERSLYITGARAGDGDNFFGDAIESKPSARTLELDAIDGEARSSARLELRLRGLTRDVTVAVRLNGVAVGQVVLPAQTPRDAALGVPHALLREGENQLELRTLPLAKGEAFAALKWARLSYQRRLVARDDALAFTVAGGVEVAVDGFSGAGVELFDVTDPFAVRRVAATVTPSSGGHQLRATVPSAGPRMLWAASSKTRRAPTPSANRPSRWHAHDNSAGLAVISHGDFITAAERLAAHRRGQGWTVAVADVEDLYDEFSFGDRAPEALRCMLGRSRQAWSRAPSHVLLLGDTSFDPRDFLGLGAPTAEVPTRSLPDGELVAPADEWLLGKGVQGSAIGRLPVRTAAEARWVVDRLVAFDSAPTGDWQRRLLVVSDTDESGDAARGFDFHAPQAELTSAVTTAGFEAVQLLVTPAERQAASAKLREELGRGAAVVDYFGHGSVQVWSSSFVDGDVADGLDNDKLPLVIGATCLNGMFDDLYTRSLAERLVVRATGGAIAAFAPSNRGFPSLQQIVNRALVSSLTSGETATLGQAVLAAKTEGRERGSVRFWNLFGDPSLQLPAMSRPFAEAGAADPRLGQAAVRRVVGAASALPLPPVASATPVPAPASPGVEPGPPLDSSGCRVGSSPSQTAWPVLLFALALFARRRRRCD